MVGKVSDINTDGVLRSEYYENRSNMRGSSSLALTFVATVMNDEICSRNNHFYNDGELNRRDPILFPPFR